MGIWMAATGIAAAIAWASPVPAQDAAAPPARVFHGSDGKPLPPEVQRRLEAHLRDKPTSGVVVMAGPNGTRPADPKGAVLHDVDGRPLSADAQRRFEERLRAAPPPAPGATPR